nr:hypothetical protein CFP56_45318 [Quercus suber]
MDTATSCVRKEGKDCPKMGEVEVGLEHAQELQESTGAARKYVDPVISRDYRELEPSVGDLNCSRIKTGGGELWESIQIMSHSLIMKKRKKRQGNHAAPSHATGTWSQTYLRDAGFSPCYDRSWQGQEMLSPGCGPDDDSQYQHGFEVHRDDQNGARNNFRND